MGFTSACVNLLCSIGRQCRNNCITCSNRSFLAVFERSSQYWLYRHSNHIASAEDNYRSSSASSCFPRCTISLFAIVIGWFVGMESANRAIMVKNKMTSKLLKDLPLISTAHHSTEIIKKMFALVP